MKYRKFEKNPTKCTHARNAQYAYCPNSSSKHLSETLDSQYPLYIYIYISQTRACAKREREREKEKEKERERERER